MHTFYTAAGTPFLDDGEFIDWQGSGYKLHIILDPDNRIQEEDEDNNEFVIDDVTVVNQQECAGEFVIATTSFYWMYVPFQYTTTTFRFYVPGCILHFSVLLTQFGSMYPSVCPISVYY